MSQYLIDRYLILNAPTQITCALLVRNVIRLTLSDASAGMQQPDLYDVERTEIKHTRLQHKLAMRCA